MKNKILETIERDNIHTMSALIATFADDEDSLHEIFDNSLYWTLVLERNRTDDHILKAGEGKWLEKNINDFDYKEEYEVIL